MILVFCIGKALQPLLCPPSEQAVLVGPQLQIHVPVQPLGQIQADGGAAAAGDRAPRSLVRPAHGQLLAVAFHSEGVELRAAAAETAHLCARAACGAPQQVPRSHSVPSVSAPVCGQAAVCAAARAAVVLRAAFRAAHVACARRADHRATSPQEHTEAA